MTRKLFTAALALSFAVTGSTFAQMKKNPTAERKQADPAMSARRINRDEALKLYKANKAVFVDVRSKETFDTGHIKGAVSIPGSQVAARYKELPQGKMVITYCACVEEHSAALAVLNLNGHGISNAAALIGGWNEWTALGLPTEKSK